MSGINATVRINDGMSPAMKSMNKALNIVLNSFEKLQSASGNAIDTSDIVDARAELNNVAIAVSRVEQELEQAANKQNKFKDEVENSESAMSGLVKNAIGLVGAYASMQTVMGAVNLSDQMTQVEARLDLVVDDTAGETVDGLTDKIMASANNARAGYLATANAVTSFAQRAGDSFKDANNKLDMNQVIGFTETLNKMYVIAGASAEEQSSSMLQLTQALGSGVLRGEEFNSVFEAAPNIMQAVAEHMNIPIGQLRSMAEEGKITADIVKNAIFSASEEVNADFESMNMTWTQVMTLFKNRAIESLDPVLKKINELANNQKVQTFVMGLGNAVALVANGILSVFEVIASVGSFMYDNWSILQPLIMGIVIALGLYTAALIAYNTVQAITNGLKAIAAFRETVHAAAQAMATGSTFAATAAQYGFNAALFACPIVWIIAAILALVVAFYMLVSWINKTEGISVSATGVIFAAFAGLAAAIVNYIIMIYNWIATLAEFLLNVFENPVYSIKKLFANLAILILDFCISATKGFDDVATNIANAFIEGINMAISAVNWIIDKLNDVLDLDLDNISEFSKTVSITSTLEDTKSDIQDWVGEAPEGYVELEKKDYIDVSSWADAGYNFGAGVEDKISDLTSIDSLMNDTITDGLGTLGNIADNTGSMADSMEITEEDLKYLRDIAEQEAINRFTTAEIKIDMNNNNTIGSNMDIDGIVTSLEEKLYESMEIAAEGVH